MGQTPAYEKALKAQVIKFHNGDDKRYAEQIMSRTYSGCILVTSALDQKLLNLSNFIF
jgi:hypothetical protein